MNLLDVDGGGGQAQDDLDRHDRPVRQRAEMTQQVQVLLAQNEVGPAQLQARAVVGLGGDLLRAGDPEAAGWMDVAVADRDRQAAERHMLELADREE